MLVTEQQLLPDPRALLLLFHSVLTDTSLLLVPSAAVCAWHWLNKASLLCLSTCSERPRSSLLVQITLGLPQWITVEQLKVTERRNIYIYAWLYSHKWRKCNHYGHGRSFTGLILATKQAFIQIWNPTFAIRTWNIYKCFLRVEGSTISIIDAAYPDCRFLHVDHKKRQFSEWTVVYQMTHTHSYRAVNDFSRRRRNDLELDEKVSLFWLHNVAVSMTALYTQKDLG